MLVHNGRLTVTGGVQADGRLMRDSEEFDGKRWIDSRSNLREPRQGFSLIKVLNLFIHRLIFTPFKVPASRFSKRRRPRSRALSNRKTQSESPKHFPFCDRNPAQVLTGDEGESKVERCSLQETMCSSIS